MGYYPLTAGNLFYRQASRLVLVLELYLLVRGCFQALTLTYMHFNIKLKKEE